MTSMLRITEYAGDGELALRLEGDLTGPWVQELETCWQRASAALAGRRLRVDLTSVCQVDAAGRDLLTAMHAAGAHFVTRGCVMPEVVREISTCRTANHRRDTPRQTTAPDDRVCVAETGHPAGATEPSRRS